MTWHLTNESTLGELLRNRAEERGEDLFAHYREEHTSYAALYRDSCRVARGLHELGVRKGDKVAILMNNCLEYLAIWFGIALLGAVEVPLNYNYKGRSLAYGLAQSDSNVLFLEDSLLPRLLPLRSELTKLKQVIIFARDKTEQSPDCPWESVAWRQLMQVPPVAPSVSVRHFDLMAIMYTSGSTGLAKGVMLAHRYALHFSGGKVRHMRTGPADCIFNCYPLFNATGQFETTLPALIAGGRVAHVHQFSASKFWDQIRRYNATEFVYMGGILSILYKQPPYAEDADNPVRAAYGVPTPPEIHREFECRFGLRLIEVYGSTEANVVTYNPYDDNRVGSCGKPTAGLDIRLVDDNDEEVPAGAPGEILVRPQHPFIVLQGYYKMPEQTLKAFQNLWYHSGDLGRLDEDGFLYFLGRKDERIRRLGYNISPAEIENITNMHPEILESAVVGVRSVIGEEDVLLVVLPRPGHSPDPANIFNFCAENLPYYMVPRYIRFVTEFPKTPTLRIEKFRLKEEGVVAGCWDSVDAGMKVTR